MKILAYLVLTIGLLFLFTATAVWVHRFNRDLENPNSVELVNHSDIPTNDLRVDWSASGASPLTLYEQGTDNKETFEEYGSNYFRLMYKDSLLAEYWQFKTNNWHGHHYTFNIEQLNDSLNIQLLINGPDTIKVQRSK